MTLAGWVAEVTIPVPNVPWGAGFALVISAMVAVGGLFIKFRGRQVMDWGDLIERQEKIITQQDVKIARLEHDLDVARDRRRNGIEGPG